MRPNNAAHNQAATAAAASSNCKHAAELHPDAQNHFANHAATAALQRRRPVRSGTTTRCKKTTSDGAGSQAPVPSPAASLAPHAGAG